jgi:hypothetical protein
VNFVSVPYYFQDGTTFLAEYINADFTALIEGINAIITFLNAQTSAPGYPTFINAAAAPFNMAVANNAGQNTTALQSAVNAAVTAGGGIIFIPAGTYQMSGPVTVSGLTGGIIIQGSSCGTQLIVQGNVNLFNVSGNNGVFGGTRFRDLSIQYPKGATTGIAISGSSGGEPVTAEFCLFTNCPQAMSCGDQFSGLINCFIVQNNVNNSVQVAISATQCFVVGCIMQQQSISSGGPAGTVGVQMYSGSDSTWIFRNHFSLLNQSIVQVNGRFTYIVGNTCEAYTNSIFLQASSPSASIYGVVIVGNKCMLGPNSTAQSSGIYIDSNGGAASNVAGIYLSGNMIFGFGNAGLQVNVAQDVVVDGGQISSNGLNPSSTALGANVVVSAAALRVKLSDIDMSGVFAYNGGAAPYALAVSGSGACVASNCDMTLCGVGPLYTSSPGGLSLINCNGYNNTGALVSAATPANGASTTLASLGYYGPGTMYVTGGTVSAIKIGTNSLGITSGTVLIPSPSQTFVIDWSGSPSVVIIGS